MTAIFVKPDGAFEGEIVGGRVFSATFSCFDNKGCGLFEQIGGETMPFLREGGLARVNGYAIFDAYGAQVVLGLQTPDFLAGLWGS